MSTRARTTDALTTEQMLKAQRACSIVPITKRGLDLAIAALALLLTAPLWPLIALAIRLDSPGPALFRQLRVGRSLADRTELFVMLKFRSMREDAEGGTGAVWAKAHDPRVTRLGRLLRRSRLDELPQLVNVLRGEMSIIGPRPERPEITASLARALPQFPSRTQNIRPGITGLAQVSQGYDTCLDDVRRKLAFDQAYARGLGFPGAWLLMDASIVLRTVFVMAKGHAH